MIDEDTRLKDIDEELRQKLIIDLLEQADKFVIYQKYEQAYLTLRSIFNKIRPFEFKSKDNLKELTEVIDNAIGRLGGQPLDGHHKIKLAKTEMEFQQLVDLYSQQIPHALKDLGLYFKILEVTKDDDEFFFDKCFDLNHSEIEAKKEYLKNISNEQLLKHITSRQINDIYSRVIITESLTPTYPK